jgi:hypothetical protein
VTACALSWPAAVVLSVAAVCLTVLLVAVVVVSTMVTLKDLNNILHGTVSKSVAKQDDPLGQRYAMTEPTADVSPYFPVWMMSVLFRRSRGDGPRCSSLGRSAAMTEPTITNEEVA